MAEKLQYGHLNFFLITVNSLTEREQSSRSALSPPAPASPGSPQTSGAHARRPAMAKGSSTRSGIEGAGTAGAQGQRPLLPFFKKETFSDIATSLRVSTGCRGVHMQNRNKKT